MLIRAFFPLGILLLAPLAALQAADAPRKPNIVLILADDLGAESIGCYGGTSFKGLGSVLTPNLDAMAKEGMRFTTCFATPVCSPARSELLTGKYNFRTGFIDIAGRGGAVSSLDAKAHPTLAAKLQAAGYVTAVVGKWHLGSPDSMREIPATSTADTTYPHPRECGFERQCIFGGAHLERYGEPTPDSYTPARLQDWVLRFLDNRKDKPEPFFLYYASPIPHDPILPTPLNPGGTRGKNKRGDPKNYPFLIEYLDKQVGEIRQTLRKLGMAENTVVMFSGDNGTFRQITTVLRDGREIQGGKGSMLDTGSQVPLLVSWPGIVKAGTVHNGLVDFTDIMPTCLELAAAPVPQGLDGISFAPLLQGQPDKLRQWTHSLLLGKYFVRDASWKLRENGELYDVRKSPYVETLVLPANDTRESKGALARLHAVMDGLHHDDKRP